MSLLEPNPGMNPKFQRLPCSLPPPAGGRAQGEGGRRAFRGAARLTLPSLRDGPLPLPPKGRRGAPAADASEIE